MTGTKVKAILCNYMLLPPTFILMETWDILYENFHNITLIKNLEPDLCKKTVKLIKICYMSIQHRKYNECQFCSIQMSRWWFFVPVSTLWQISVLISKMFHFEANAVHYPNSVSKNQLDFFLKRYTPNTAQHRRFPAILAWIM